MTKIHIMETVLRDGQQSQIATRMTTKEMLPVFKRGSMGKIAYYS